MIALLHVVALVGLPIATIVLARRFAGRPGAVRLVLAPIVGIAAAGLTVGASFHRCDNGQPLFQWVIPALCIVAVILIVRNRLACSLAVVGLFAAGWFLSLQYSSEVHGVEYIGVPRLPADPRNGRSRDSWVRAEWHSPLTRLYHRTRSIGRVSFPGFTMFLRGLGVSTDAPAAEDSTRHLFVYDSGRVDVDWSESGADRDPVPAAADSQAAIIGGLAATNYSWAGSPGRVSGEWRVLLGQAGAPRLVRFRYRNLSPEDTAVVRRDLATIEPLAD